MSKGKWPPPGFPLVSGEYALTAEWAIRLPETFARRIEDGQMVLWRPGLTIWLIVLGNDHGESRADRLRSVKEESSPERFDERESHGGGDVSRFSYRLLDKNEDGSVESVYSFTFGDDDHVQMAVYFDHHQDEAVALRLSEAVVPRSKA